MSQSSVWQRIERSFLASAGEVVFGMEDGTVSIFGLVFGVAATTSDQSAVLVAGASGAVAAAVSMMAGTYLDVETNQARVMALRIDTEMRTDTTLVLDSVTQRLHAVGMAREQTTVVTEFLSSQPAILKGVAAALAMPGDADASQSPLVRSLWMLIADFLAAAIPILPFGFLAVPEGRVVSAIVTTMLLVALGVGRARIGGRNVVRTVTETVAVGVAAALAGVAIGVAIARIFS